MIEILIWFLFFSAWVSYGTHVVKEYIRTHKEHSPYGHVVLKEVPLEFNKEGNTSKRGR